MNTVNLVGRLIKDPEVRYTNSENAMAVAKFTVACERKFAKKGEQNADFISCISFGKQAEFVEKCFKKGSRIGIVGRIQTGNYTNKEGNKVYTTDVVTEGIEFVESKIYSDGASENKAADDGFMNIPSDTDDTLPFM